MFYKKLVRPILFRQDAERVHGQVLRILRGISNTPGLFKLIRAGCTVRNRRLEQRLFGLNFPNPVGLAAGMDKECGTFRGFEMLGFGFVEGGGITALEQDGNPKPRMFRLPPDMALINRMGFNNQGAEKTADRLRKAKRPNVPVAINIGLSKAVPLDDMGRVVRDYCLTFGLLYPSADFFVINVSSPNTPGLRTLQGREFLKILLEGIKKQNLREPRERGQDPKPILLKIAPDITFQQIDEILQVISEVGISGIVATNTTVKRDGLKTTDTVAQETGGLSGKPLRKRALQVVKYIHKKSPSLPIIGAGGIFSGSDAYDMIRAGANLVQLYTGLVYEGPSLVKRINRELLTIMDCHAFDSISDIIKKRDEVPF